MAFGKKYFSSYKSNNNLDYYLEIFLEDYTGSALELVMGAGGPVIEYETDQEDRFSPIISSSCKIPYLVENYLDSLFIDDLRNNYQERQVYVHIYRSTQSGYSAVAPLWSGFLVMDIGSGVDKYFPYEEHLKFVDGLSLLKDIDFVDLGVTGGTPPFEERVQGNYAQENMYYGPATYIYWIREILAKSGAALTNQGASQNYGFTTSVNWYNGEMNATGQSSDPLHKTKCAVSMFHRKDDQGVFYPDNCYNVLKELLRHWGARITYWKHEFWIVQIPEYITSESGTISTPVNNNSRLYSNTGAYQGSQNHLGSTYYTRYEQTIQNDKISKLTGTKYDYLPIIKQVNADFLSFSSKSYFGGFPFGGTATTQEVFQGTINSPSAADFLYLSIPLDWTWDLSNAPNFPNGHSNGWWCAIKFNFYASDGTTTYYLQYNSAGGNYFWVDSALWTPLGNRAPKYIISSKLAVVTGHIGFEQQIPFEDENGNAISMSGAWSFFLDIDDYGTGSSNPGSFYINFSGYGSPQRMRNPGTAIQLPAGSGVMSGTVSWSNTLVDQQGQVTISTINNPAGFNAGTANPDIRFATSSPFLGLLQTLNNTQSASFGETFNVINSNTQAKQNSEQFDFGTLLWGDSLEFAPSSLQVFNGTTYVNTEPSGEWGRGILTGTKTFTKILIDEFFSGQTKIIISPSMRLAVGVANKNEDQGGTLRPRYVNPIGKLRETRDGTDPEYFFRRGSFYTLLDEWDYEGYQIIRNVPSTTTQSNGMGSMGGSQSGSPASSGISPSPMVQALSQNSPLAYIRTTIPATGSNVAVNGNFNTAVGWSLGSGWSIDTTAKKAKFAATGSTSELTQSVLTQGLTYQVNFQVVVTAGTLLVKAGTSGTSQSITSSGDYSIYLDCEGSSLIKFQAGTTFTGNITYITLRDQKSLSSVPIEAIGTAVFKTGDTFNLINSNDDTILPLTVTSNQGSTDTTISVSSTPLYEDIDNGSYLLINQDDLSEQYQNKTKGTVAGFDITATGIAKSSINITDWLNSDTMSGAAVTNVPTALSVKNYVDSSVGASDTLQEVTDNGNTTTNSIRIGSSSAPASGVGLQVDSIMRVDASGGIATQKIRSSYFSPSSNLTLESGTSANIIFGDNTAEKMRLTSDGNLLLGTTTDSGSRLQVVGVSYFNGNVLIENNNELRWKDSGGTQRTILELTNTNDLYFGGSFAGSLIFIGGGSYTERARISDSGNFLIGTTTDNSAKVNIATSGSGSVAIRFNSNVTNDLSINNYSNYSTIRDHALSNNRAIFHDTGEINLPYSLGVGLSGLTKPSEKLHVVGKGIFTDQLTIPATPVATTDAASKSYVDAQVATSDTLSEVLALGNTSGANDIIMANNQSYKGTHLNGSSVYGLLTLTSGNVIKMGGYDYTSAAVEIGCGDHAKFLIGSTEKMRLTSGGNLLLGTTTDSGAKLEISDSTSPDLILRNPTANPVNAGKIKFIESVNSDGFELTFNGFDNKFKFISNSSGTLTERVTIDRNTGATTLFGSLAGTTATFSGDNTISKAYPKLLLNDTQGVNRNFSVGTNNETFTVRNETLSSDAFLIVGANNNVLIGTTTDSGAKLKITTSENATTSTSLYLENTGSGGSEGVSIVFNPMFGATSMIASNREGANSGLTNLSFHTCVVNDNPPIERMRLTSGGNLLLGTTTDSGAKLQITASASAQQTAILKGYDVGATDNIIIQNSSGTKTFSVSNNGQVNIDGSQKLVTSDASIELRNNATGLMSLKSGGNYGITFGDNGGEAMRINTSTNNVLIGTTTDSGDKLQVNGNIQILDTDASDGSVFGYLNFTSTTGGSSGNHARISAIRDSNSAGQMLFSTKSGGSVFERLRITSAGNVLIGTTSASGEKLEVNGTAKITGTAKIIGNVSIGGSVGAVYKLDVVGKARVQSVLELDDVLTLNAISTPSDPASGKSSIYMDSADGAIKVKINVGGTVVTRTIASFE
jgi:hypothetical protein